MTAPKSFSDFEIDCSCKSHSHRSHPTAAGFRHGSCRLATVAPLVLAIGLLTGCGSDESSSGSATSPTTGALANSDAVSGNGTVATKDSATQSLADSQTIPTTATSASEPLVIKRSSNFVTKEQIDRYSNGKVRRGYEARFYPDGEMVFHGRFVEFWETGKKHSKGRYVEGKKEGEWTYWHGNGRIAKKGSFVNGKLEGRWLYVTEDGRPKHRDHYKDGLRHGELIVFDKATGTKVVRKVHFQNGVKHGIATEYYSNGNVMMSTTWVDGKEHGKRESFYENGNKLSTTEYSKGKLNGHVIEWSPTGAVQSDIVYVNDVPQPKSKKDS